ncbi:MULTISPECIES: hypothetical protein [unclassified Arthrobacter]|uniref:arsenate reductase/protein-tyrosine-phosphatase family protein n=1 Tax=unclassified Arthrobacter TaxID=235627 RepID=UPI00138F1632|nr:hypothetical protein [Arthrobacter sp. Leaf234]
MYNVRFSLSYLPSLRPRRVRHHPERSDPGVLSPPIATTRKPLFTILVACTANICRSPLAAFSLGQRLGQAGPDGLFAVTSAGTRARTGDRICPCVGEELASDHPGRRYAEGHTSRRVTEAAISAADLILLPDFENRTRIALLDPVARHRSFTFREADRLLASLAVEGIPPLRDVVPVMHAIRSRAAMSAGSRRWPQLRRPSDGLDILDGHNLGSRRHRRTVRDVGLTSSSIAARLEESALVDQV